MTTSTRVEARVATQLTLANMPPGTSKQAVGRSRRLVRYTAEKYDEMMNQLARARDNKGPSKLGDHEVKQILENTHLTNRYLADLLNVSQSTIQKVRQGLSYREVCPDIPRHQPSERRQGKRCQQCVHWELRAGADPAEIGCATGRGAGKCCQGSPEFAMNGDRTAVRCSMFMTAEERAALFE